MTQQNCDLKLTTVV